jgi:hypothetical protein
MKKTGDPLKKVETNKSSADATNVSMNVPKAPIRERISNIPMRFQEKQQEQIRMLQERGYAPMYKSDGKGGMVLEGYSPQGKSFAVEAQESRMKKYK